MTDHAFARDRAPIASTALPTLWRYRWACTCGATGRWQVDDYSLTEARRDWQRHVAARGRVDSAQRDSTREAS